MWWEGLVTRRGGTRDWSPGDMAGGISHRGDGMGLVTTVYGGGNWSSGDVVGDWLSEDILVGTCHLGIWEGAGH